MRHERRALLALLVCACAGDGLEQREPAAETREASEPEPVPLDRWIVGAVDARAVTAVETALDTGAFRAPAPGESYLGIDWSAVEPGPGGEIPLPDGAQAMFAVAEVTVAEHERLFARPDRVQQIQTQLGGLQPGDVYGSGRSRVPLRVRAGRNLIVALAGNGASVGLLRTTSEVAFDVADVTSPDLVAGTSTTQWLGLPVLALEDHALGELHARVLESEVLRGTDRVIASLTPGAAAQVAFELAPRASWPAGVESVPVTLEVSSRDLLLTYRQEVEVPVVAPGTLHRRTRISRTDGSVQYYAVLPPTGGGEGAHGLILSLHGAAVEAAGQAAAYSAKDWAYLVAPTNRRPFGFDWEEWGRLDAIEALDDALAVLPIDPGRVHLTGHSMGGHGTWHVGVHFSPRFGLIGPSAGWISFATYGGSSELPPAVQIARAASDTLRFVENLRGHTVFVIHGTADDNVPFAHATTMVDSLTGIVDDLQHHYEPGAGHWWDADGQEPGADCVDWEPMIARMKEITFDPVPLSFDHRAVSPWVNPTHSFVTVRSELDPAEDVTLRVRPAGEGEVTVETTNARSLVLDGVKLEARGVRQVTVDGVAHAVSAAPLPIGPQDGKNEAVHGPMNQAFHRPFCFVWPDGARAYQDLAAYLASTWNVIGNGHACGLPLSRLTDSIARDHNLIWLGVPEEQVRGVGSVPMHWSETELRLGDSSLGAGAMQFVFPAGDRLNAVMTATSGSERYLRFFVPFSSRSGMPDFAAIGGSALGFSYTALGFFTPEWEIDLRHSTF